jgi:hypothetical protein
MLICINIVNILSSSVLAIVVGWKLGLAVVFGALFPIGTLLTAQKNVWVIGLTFKNSVMRIPPHQTGVQTYGRHEQTICKQRCACFRSSLVRSHSCQPGVGATRHRQVQNQTARRRVAIHQSFDMDDVLVFFDTVHLWYVTYFVPWSVS